MKHRIFALSLALAAISIPTPAHAQGEVYTVSLPASQVAELDLGRQQHNKRICESAGQAEGCNQQSVCVALGIGVDPPNCTAGEANAAEKRIFNNNLAGREAFVTLELVKAPLASFVLVKAEQSLATMAAVCKNPATTQIKKDTFCTAASLSAGCGICDAFK